MILACALLCGSAYGQSESNRLLEYFKWRMLSERDEFGRVPLDALSTAAEQRKALVIGRPQPSARGTISPEGTVVAPEAAGITAQRWTALGPGNIGGRIRSLVIHPTNPQKIWVGSVSGGIWTTSDGGASWQPVDDNLPSLSISSLAIDPTNPNVLYAGTGELVYSNLSPDAIRGVGVYKSVDGGVTWSRLPQTDPALNGSWAFVHRIAVHPSNGNIVLAVNTSGIYRSTDAGATWHPVSTGATFWDVRFNPADGSKAVAGASGAVYSSTDAGATWTAAPLANGSGGRVETAYAPSSPNVVYASLDMNQGQIYRSTNGGVSWTLMSNPQHLSTQGWWANAIWVAPTDPNLVVIGGLELYRSTDGALSFTLINNGGAPVSPHLDEHAIVNDPGYNGTTNRRVYVTTDGGVYKAEDITLASRALPPNGWTNLNNGIAITQFYGGGGRPGGALIGGTQDNGTLYSASGTNWAVVVGSDGGFAALDPVETYAYAETIFLSMWRSPDGVNSWQQICNGIQDADCGAVVTRNANFIAPFIVDPNNSMRLLAGGASLWRSNDAKAPTPTWSAIKAPTNNFISAIAVAQGNSDVIWVGHNSGQVYKTVNGTAASPTWTLVSGPLPARFASRILIDKSDPNTVYVTFGGYTSSNVWKTTDGGATWTNIHGALPQTPIRSITRHPLKPAWIYVGTEVGVFSSENAGASWFTTNDAPANVSVDELFWPDNATLVAATHGRGMFRVTALAAPVRGDFNGDGHSDILWRNVSTGENYLYFMNGTSIGGEGFLRTVADLNWKIAGVGDFDGDGKADILWRNSSTGEDYIYLMNGTAIAGEGFIRTVADQNWQVAGVGDFNGDGKDDILWRNAVTGENYIYLMNGTTIVGEGFIRTVADQSWKVVGVGDFDGDAKADILWRNSSTGQNYVYPMNGTAIKASEGYLRTVADQNWKVAGVGDLDGDAKADIVWRNSATGENYLYPMDGTTIKSTEGFLRTVSDLNWHIVAVGDYDGDGKSDLLWRNVSTGENYIYPLDGTTIKPSEGFLRTVADQNWQVQK
jgi:photosystem II stability/assembly factor-like uncharacterized protein